MSEVRAGYNKTEVGLIPNEWVSAKISDACSMKSGEAITSDNIDDGSKYPCYGGNGLRGYTGRFTHDGSYALIGRQGALCGNVLGVRGKFFASEHAIVIDTTPQTNIIWLTYLLKKMGLNQYSESSAQPGLSAIKLLNLRIPRPPFEEQESIAAALSDADALITALDRLIAKKRDLKQAAMQQLLTGQTRLPGFRGAWQVKTLGDLFHFSGGYSASREQLSDKGYCYLHYGDIHGSAKTIVEVENEYQDIPKLDIRLNRVSKNALLENGDVVFVDASEDDEGTSKHVVVVKNSTVPFIAGLHTIVAKGLTDELTHAYRRYCFQTLSIRQQFLFYSVGTKVSGINKSNIGKLKIAFPGKSEQIAIAAVLSDMDAEIAALERRREKTRALKQGMMQELLTGRTRLV
jgi:type I restriction enzyme S subunit